MLSILIILKKKSYHHLKIEIKYIKKKLYYPFLILLKNKLY